MQLDNLNEGPKAKTVDEFARDWRLGRTTVYSLVNQGRLRLVKIGKSTRILAEDEAKFAESLRGPRSGAL